MLYCAVTVILFVDNILPYLINTAVDAMFLVALVVISIIVGKPVSYLNCKALGELSNATSSAYDFTSALGNSLNKGGSVDYSKWIGTSEPVCYQIKAVWGISIAECILFTLSAVCTICLWRRTKQAVSEKGEA